jgi:stage III sporulation protein AE
MKLLPVPLLLISQAVIPASALEITAPSVPESGSPWMPENTESFSNGLWELLNQVLSSLHPEFSEALQTAMTVFCIILLFSFLLHCTGNIRKNALIAGSVLISTTLLQDTNTLIRLGSNTITELSEYGKLLLPVMTAALAGQGGGSTSTVLYAGTAVFDMVLTGLITKFLLPGVYFFLAMATANSALGEDILKRLRDFGKWLISWTLKTILMIFTTYMSISGVVSGTTDAVALKTAKFTISNVVPVVGGILSDASEAVLVSAGLVKNAAGIYGILAMLAVFLAPFLNIGTHYLVLKMTAAVTGLFGPKELTTLVEDFSTAMGLLLAMTSATCLLQLISTVCFLKGVG